MPLLFFCLFLGAGICNFISSILILRGMAEAGTKVNFFEIRWQVHKHLKDYRELTLERTGPAAWPYYAYKASLAATIGFAILTLLALGK